MKRYSGGAMPFMGLTMVALVGMGLILVYRANRIVNFAQGSMAAATRAKPAAASAMQTM